MASILPKKVRDKISKTGMTRGAEDDEAYQNRVNRNNTVLIPLSMWIRYQYLHEEGLFERSFIVLIPPSKIEDLSDYPELTLGKNAVVFYETRSDWNNYPPKDEWSAAMHRPFERENLGGEYIARVPALPSDEPGSERIFKGYTTTKKKGAGIRFYEYASNQTIKNTRLQLTSLFLMCYDVVDCLAPLGHSEHEIEEYRRGVFAEAERNGLLDMDKLKEARIINDDGVTICPLCLKPLSAKSFADALPQAEGREVQDLTVTETSLFHIEELKASKLNHRPYNLGWGHHFCNVVVKDSGIEGTLEWMKEVLVANSIIS